MKKKNFCVAALLTATFGLSTLMAQQTVPTSGGNASSADGTVSYTVGQLVSTTVTGISGTVAQGVQQAYEISTVTGMELMGIDLQYAVYPNPTTDFLVLKVKENAYMGTCDFQLIDMNGRLMATKQIKAGETIIPMNEYSRGAYLLKITNTKSTVSKEIKSFKIIKK
ncbi:MAG: T9SS type A sorting domain-containing protein [Paludibacter sp.]